MNLSLAIDLGRSLPNTYNRLAIALQNSSEGELAIQYLQQAIDKEPGYGLVYANQGLCISQYRGDEWTALDLYNRAIEIDPYLATAYVDRGDLTGDTSDPSTYPQAIADYNRAIAIDPGSALAYAHRGQAYMWAGDWIQAEADLLRALEINPYYEYPLWDLAAIYGHTGRYEAAVDCYNRVVALEQQHWLFARLYRAQDHLMLGQYDLALADMNFFFSFAESQSSRTDFRVTAHMVRAAVYLRLAESDPAQYVHAAEDYRSAFEVDPYQAAGFYTWGQAYGVMLDNEQIIEDLRAQLIADPQNPDTWRQLATEYMQRGRFTMALQTNRQAWRTAAGGAVHVGQDKVTG